MPLINRGGRGFGFGPPEGGTLGYLAPNGDLLGNFKHATRFEEGLAIVTHKRKKKPVIVDHNLKTLAEVQLDAYGRVRIEVENVDLAPMLAEALEAVADHWLSR